MLPASKPLVRGDCRVRIPCHTPSAGSNATLFLLSQDMSSTPWRIHPRPNTTLGILLPGSLVRVAGPLLPARRASLRGGGVPMQVCRAPASHSRSPHPDSACLGPAPGRRARHQYCEPETVRNSCEGGEPGMRVSSTLGTKGTWALSSDLGWLAGGAA